MNAGVLAFDSTGRIEELAVADFPNPHFNGGTPTGDLGYLVGAAYSSGFTPFVYVGGLPYTAGGALVVDFFGPITHYVAGIPMTDNGVAVDAGDAKTWVGGIPLSIVGKVAIAVTDPTNISPFSTGFSDGFQ